MNNTIDGTERIIRINYRLAQRGFDALDTEQRALLLLDPARMTDAAKAELATELEGLFDDLRDRVGVNCDDLWPVFVGSQFLAHAIAQQFARNFADLDGGTHVNATADANAKEENPSICHTHDVCDANVLMADAFRTVCGRSFLTSNPTSPQAQEDAKLWNESWRIARAVYVTRIGYALASAGFKCEHQGGGLWNWRIDLKNGLELYACAEDGTEPTDSEPVQIGLMLAASDSICSNEYAFGAGLAEILNAREGVK